MKKTHDRTRVFLPGHSACEGCGNAIASKLILEAIGPDCVMIMPPGCTSVFTIVPFCNLNIPSTTCTFAGSAAVASGISDGFRIQRKNSTIYVLAGDGGSADIGLQAISGALRNNQDMIFFCLNNYAYQNTGNQPSGMSQINQETSLGINKEKPKDLFMIVCAHSPIYAATASVSRPLDLQKKIRKAMSLKGFKFIEVLCPCPTGMRFEPALTLKKAEEVIENGIFKLKEYSGD